MSNPPLAVWLPVLRNPSDGGIGIKMTMSIFSGATGSLIFLSENGINAIILSIKTRGSIVHAPIVRPKVCLHFDNIGVSDIYILPEYACLRIDILPEALI